MIGRRGYGVKGQLHKLAIEAIVNLWYQMPMGEMRKITVEVPVETLEAALSGGGTLAETVREALRELAHKRACQRILAMEGKLDLGLDLEELRKDKDEV